MLVIYKKILIMLLSVMILISCQNRNVDLGAKARKSSGKPIVRLDNKVLHESDFFDFAYVTLKEMDPSTYNNAAVKEKLMQDFIEFNLLVIEAERRNIKIDDKRLNTVLESFQTEKGAQDLKVYSGSYSTDRDRLAELIRRRLLVESLIDRVAGEDITVTDRQIRDYYNKYISRTKPSLRAHLLQIFTHDRKKAEQAVAELKKGISFNEVAERYSEGAEKDNGGDLGFVSQNDLPVVFSQAFKLPAGKPSNIVKSEYGYHIFLVKNYERAKNVDYNSMKSKIRLELYTRELEKKTRDFIDELYKNTDIKYLNNVDFDDFAADSER